MFVSHEKLNPGDECVGYHGSSKMAVVVATAALLSSSITASLAVLQLEAFRDCRKEFPDLSGCTKIHTVLNLTHGCAPDDTVCVISNHLVTV